MFKEMKSAVEDVSVSVTLKETSEPRKMISLKEVLEIIDDAEKKYGPERKPDWIPCSEKLPGGNEWHLKVWLSFSGQYGAETCKAVWHMDHFEWENCKVIKKTPDAWMPYYKPEPYRP